MWQKLLGLAVAGAVGTLLRYGLAGAVQRASGSGFPWGTFIVNIAGCFMAGAFASFAYDRASISGEMRAVVIIGFLGGFTTFSAFMLETSELMRHAQWAWAFGNLLLQNVLGLACLFLGLAAGRLI